MATTTLLFFFSAIVLLFSGCGSATATTAGKSSGAVALRTPSLRHLPTASCSRLQHELQRSILEYEWVGLDRLRFQRRLRRHPRYIVTIENVVSAHDPLVELRCPGSPGENRLEIHFHESRFSAKSVRLFDIRSIFPIHSGAMGGVRVRIPPMGVELSRGGLDLGRSVVGVSFFEENNKRGGSSGGGHGRINFNSDNNNGGKENEDELIRHREDDDDDDDVGGSSSSLGGVVDMDDNDNVGVGVVTSSLVGVEREIEGIFVGRVLPLVKAQLEAVVFNTTAAFFEDNLVLF